MARGWARPPPTPRPDQVYAKELKEFRNGVFTHVPEDELHTGYVVVPASAHAISQQQEMMNWYLVAQEKFKVTITHDSENPGVLVVKAPSSSDMEAAVHAIALHQRNILAIVNTPTVEVECFPSAKMLPGSQMIKFAADGTGTVRPRLSPSATGIDARATRDALVTKITPTIRKMSQMMAGHLQNAMFRINIGILGTPNCPAGTQLKAAGFESLLEKGSKMTETTFDTVLGSRAKYERLYSILYNFREQHPRPDEYGREGMVMTDYEVRLWTKDGIPFVLEHRESPELAPIWRATVRDRYNTAKSIRVACLDQPYDYEFLFEHCYYNTTNAQHKEIADELFKRVLVRQYPDNLYGRFEVKTQGRGPMKTQIARTEITTTSRFMYGDTAYDSELMLTESWKGLGTESNMETATTFSVGRHHWPYSFGNRYVQEDEEVDILRLYEGDTLEEGLCDCIDAVLGIQELISSG